ncbi:hypothetical protein [Kibdelosporangium aridum]|uniref:hypothetical protein n=1 Tax=Kibdelosporangium aridum TaxID=2030 RepID=UPI0021AD58A3|nr:hypothetical protein [Kibdelosporangium aridum]
MERRTFLRASALSVGLAGAAGATATAANPLRVQVLMFDGVAEQDFVAPVEVLGLAGKMSGGAIRTTLVTTGRPGTVTCTYLRHHGGRGARLVTRRHGRARGAGWRLHDRTGPGVHRLIADQGFLRRLAAADALPVGICTGTMVLFRRGHDQGPQRDHAQRCEGRPRCPGRDRDQRARGG